MFHYYRSREDIRKLIQASPEPVRLGDEVRKLIEHRHEVELLGTLVMVDERNFYLRPPRSAGKKKYPLSGKLMIRLVEDGIFTDAWGKHENIELFGKVENNRWLSCIALNVDRLKVIHEPSKS